MEKSRARRDKNLFVIEGVRELEIALKNGFSMQYLLICPDILKDKNKAEWFREHTSMVLEIDAQLYGKLAYRDSTEGVLAVMKGLSPGLNDIRLSETPLVIILESIEKPGNLGAILRTADASGVDAVLVCDPLTDLYNPNTIRASLGCLFSVPTLTCSSAQAYDWLKDKGLQVIAATCQSVTPYHQCDFKRPTAFVTGTEDRGLSSFWRERATCEVIIPMKGIIDSLNVSVATAILCFEAVRQRNG